MIDFESRVNRAALLTLDQQWTAAIAEYESLLADVEAAGRHFAEADLRSDFARLLHEAGDAREGQQLTKAAALFKQRGDVHGHVDVCLRLSRFYLASPTAAMYWADRAVAAAEQGASEQDLCLALACRGELLMAAGRFEEALAALHSAVQLPGGHVHAVALASAQIAAGQVQQGVAMLTRALADAERATGDGAPESWVCLAIRLADARRALGEPVAALALLKAAAARAGQLTDGGTYALLMDRLGLALLESGDASAAARMMELGIERVRAQPQPEMAQLASLHSNLGNALATLGNHPGAIRSFAEAIRLTRGVNPGSEALAWFGLANSAAKAGEPAEARAAYDEARGLAVRLQNRRLEAACLDSLGQLHTKSGEPAKAIDLQRQAAALHEKAGDYTGQHTDLMNLVQSLLLLGETPAARRVLDEARAVAAAHLSRLPWQHSLNEGQVLARESRWPQARKAFEAAITRLEAERSTLATPSDQRLWAAQRVEAFEIATAAAFEAHDAVAAISFLEGNRGRFLEAVSERRRRLPPELSVEARAAYTSAVDRLSQLRWRRRQQPEVADRQLEADLASAERYWRELDVEVERLRMHQAASPEPVPKIDDLAGRLSAGEAAVALHVAADWIGAACVGREPDGALWWGCSTDAGLTLAELSRIVVGSAEGDTMRIHPAWQDLMCLPLADTKQLIASVCDRIGHVVWPLVEHLLQGRAESLVLMPGRGLNVLPLHAMETSDGRRAMDRWSVRYAPSLRLFASAGPPGSLQPTRVLGQVVDPTGDLPFAATEAAAIRRTWRGGHGDALIGEQARPDAVLALFGHADVLHFAGHGAFDPEDPLQSRLLCAPGKDSGALTLQAVLNEVAAARTRVVLLSACETGRVVAGDPLNDQLGLPGGLLIAGAAAILATFWPVDDLAACLVLSRCLELWDKGAVDLEMALAQAQSWLRDQATIGVILGWLEDQIDSSGAADPQLELTYGRLSARDENELVFASEIHWAPFHVTGAAVRVQ